MRINPTRQTPPTEAEIAARQVFFEESQRHADRLNAEFMLAKQQQDAAEFQNRLVEATSLSVEQLIAIKTWLSHHS
jgi:hypothetical protein